MLASSSCSTMEKWFAVVLFLLSSYELVYGQCFLSIGMTQFQNLYSLEIRPDYWDNDRYCCCDAEFDTCQYNKNQFSMDTCEAHCDTYFVLSFLDCQDLPSCSVTITTDISHTSATTTDVDYDFQFIVSSSAVDSVEFEIEMRDSDDEGDSFREIDTFDITATFPSDNQEQVLTGNRGIATITLTYDLICIEPDACTTAVVSSEVIGTCAVTDTTTSTVTSTSTEVETSMQITISTSTAITTSTSTKVKSVTSTAIINSTSTSIATSTSTKVKSVTSTAIINSTSTTIATSTITEVQLVTSTAIINSTSTTIATSTSTEVQSVTTTATMSTVMTISATPRAITVTRTVSANSSPGDPSVGEQSAGSSDSISIIWMLLFIIFALLTIVAVMVSIYLACLLKKKKFKTGSIAGNVTLVQTNSLPPIDNPVYGSQGNNGKNGAQEAREVYSTLANDLYGDESASPMHGYSTCGPAKSPTNEQYEYVRTKPINASAVSPYEAPTTLARSK